jgi:hypothetical protein
MGHIHVCDDSAAPCDDPEDQMVVAQMSAEWTESHFLDRVLLRDSGPWTDTNRDTVLEQGYEASGLSPQDCCPRCAHKKATIISGVRERRDPHTTPSQEQDRTSQERYLD